MIITAGKYKGKKIKTPSQKITRPTLSKTREGIFNVLNSMFNFECKNFLDLFAGSGIMGLEALSRGFLNVTSVEMDTKTASLIRENYKLIGEKCELYKKNTLCFLKNCQRKYDVIYVDPPYQNELYEPVIELISQKNILEDNGVLIFELPEKMEFITEFFEIIKEKKYSSSKILFFKNKEKI